MRYDEHVIIQENKIEVMSTNTTDVSRAEWQLQRKYHMVSRRHECHNNQTEFRKCRAHSITEISKIRRCTRLPVSLPAGNSYGVAEELSRCNKLLNALLDRFPGLEPL